MHDPVYPCKFHQSTLLISSRATLYRAWWPLKDCWAQMQRLKEACFGIVSSSPRTVKALLFRLQSHNPEVNASLEHGHPMQAMGSWPALHSFGKPTTWICPDFSSGIMWTSCEPMISCDTILLKFKKMGISSCVSFCQSRLEKQIGCNDLLYPMITNDHNDRRAAAAQCVELDGLAEDYQVPPGIIWLESVGAPQARQQTGSDSDVTFYCSNASDPSLHWQCYRNK